MGCALGSSMPGSTLTTRLDTEVCTYLQITLRKKKKKKILSLQILCEIMKTLGLDNIRKVFSS